MFDDLLNQTQLSRKDSIIYQTGIDCEDKCQDIKWYKNYPYDISYEINHMGFRDDNHEMLRGKIFAIGDSFTMGIGQPYEHTWPYLLGSLLDESIVKLAADGISNDWIRAVFDRIVDLRPKAVFIMLSFLHREMLSTQSGLKHLHYNVEESYQPDWAENMLERTIENLSSIEQQATKSNIPVFFTAVPEFDLICKSASLRGKMISYPRFESSAPFRVLQRFDDLARDGFHFGKKTCETIAKNLYSSYRESNK